MVIVIVIMVMAKLERIAGGNDGFLCVKACFCFLLFGLPEAYFFFLFLMRRWLFVFAHGFFYYRFWEVGFAAFFQRHVVFFRV